MKIIEFTKYGQPFYDESVYLKPKPRSIITQNIDYLCGKRPPQSIHIGYQRVPLNYPNLKGKQ